MSECPPRPGAQCTLDQWLTSALAAMLFAQENWEQFGEFMPSVIGHRPPISCGTMRHHGEHLAELADPERMPT